MTFSFVKFFVFFCKEKMQTRNNLTFHRQPRRLQERKKQQVDERFERKRVWHVGCEKM
jgi:hypothetical protein